MAKPSFAFREQQNKAVDKLKNKGYAFVDNQHNGKLLAFVDSEGFKRKAVVSRLGNVQHYRPVRASVRDKQRLPHTKPRLKKTGTNFV